MKKECGSVVFSFCDAPVLQKKLFLDDSGTNINRTDIVKYPALEKYYKKMQALFWVPEEIGLSKDRTDFASMEDHEKYIFTEVLSRAVMLDSVQGRSPAECFCPVVTNSELENTVIKWSETEANHSNSYSYIIRTIYPNGDEIFDKIMKNNGIVDCARDIAKYYDDLLYYNSLMEVNQRGGKVFDENGNEVVYDQYEHKKRIYLTLHAVQALEAIRFYSAFATFFNFAENGLMQGNAKILQMIARDESVHVGITATLIKLLPDDDHDFRNIMAECADEVVKIYNDVVNQEADWVDFIFQHGVLLGLNDIILKDYVYYIGRQKMKQFGFSEDQMDFPMVKKNPIPWVDSWLDTSNLQVAPQEIEQINYQTGAIDMNADDFDFDM